MKRAESEREGAQQKGGGRSLLLNGALRRCNLWAGLRIRREVLSEGVPDSDQLEPGAPLLWPALGDPEKPPPPPSCGGSDLLVLLTIALCVCLCAHRLDLGDVVVVATQLQASPQAVQRYGEEDAGRWLEEPPAAAFGGLASCVWSGLSGSLSGAGRRNESPGAAACDDLPFGMMSGDEGGLIPGGPSPRRAGAASQECIGTATDDTLPRTAEAKDILQHAVALFCFIYILSTHFIVYYRVGGPKNKPRCLAVFCHPSSVFCISIIFWYIYSTLFLPVLSLKFHGNTRFRHYIIDYVILHVCNVLGKRAR